MLLEGSAFLDRSGRVVVADDRFRALLGLSDGDPTAALRDRTAADPELAEVVAGGGPDRVRVRADGGADALELTRIACAEGLLLRARALEGGAAAPLPELALQGVALARLAPSIAHEVKNPLNAMALQLALLGDKIGSASEALATACAGNLGSLRNQIARIDALVRRYVDVADPTPGTGFDAGGLLADVTQLLGHEARRRRIAVTCEAAPEALRARGDAVRVARLVLGLAWRAVVGTPDGGRLLVRAAARDGECVLGVERPAGAAEPPELAWVGRALAEGARAVGGRLEESDEAGLMRAALVLPKERTP
jgi:signal transduction histidine kinase